MRSPTRLAQFESIHPFSDGNGRTGRALVHVILRNGGATTRTTVPVSAGLLSDTEAYYALTQEILKVTQPAADNALRQLQEAGALSTQKTGQGVGQKRNVVWQATEVLDALDRFGERARRNPRTG